MGEQCLYCDAVGLHICEAAAMAHLGLGALAAQARRDAGQTDCLGCSDARLYPDCPVHGLPAQEREET
jgi:hypothetical protein